jgi:hypothetical protein
MIELPDGITVRHDGQDYRLVGGRLHARLDGTPTWLLVWETDCPACGDEFEVLTPRLFYYPKRFCDGCRETLGRKHVRTWRKQQAKESEQSSEGDADGSSAR